MKVYVLHSKMPLQGSSSASGTSASPSAASQLIQSVVDDTLGSRRAKPLFVEVGFLRSYGDYGAFHILCKPKDACACRRADHWWAFPTVQTVRRDGIRASTWDSIAFRVDGVGPRPQSHASCARALRINISAVSAAKVKLLGVKLHRRPPEY